MRSSWLRQKHATVDYVLLTLLTLLYCYHELIMEEIERVIVCLRVAGAGLSWQELVQPMCIWKGSGCCGDPITMTAAYYEDLQNLREKALT